MRVESYPRRVQVLGQIGALLVLVGCQADKATNCQECDLGATDTRLVESVTEVHGLDLKEGDSTNQKDAEEMHTPVPLGPLVVMTFNTGTSMKPPEGQENQGFQAQQQAWCDEYYGNGLGWKPFVEEARRFIEEVSPDLITFQEIFDSNECPGVPQEARVGFVCEEWQPGDPIVAQLITGPEYQVVCNWGKTDKCAAVHQRLGHFRGCDGAFCLEGMQGGELEGCGSGSRIGRGTIDLVGGGELTLVNVHGSSGFLEEDSACRIRQFDQVFLDLGDGAPAANGMRNLIMGDFNTDPGVMVGSDPSAEHLLTFVGVDKPFHFVSGMGADAEKTYAGLFIIDYVVSDVFAGQCWTAGVTPGHPPVSASVGFDHHPTVCTISESLAK